MNPVCPNCGGPLSAEGPVGMCFRCLARLGTSALAESPPDVESSLGAFHYFGDYQLLEVVGRGGMGVVYRARQLTLGREVAVKTIISGPRASEDFLRRFRAEAETIARLDHENIVTIYEVGEEDGEPYFAMEFVHGTTLAAMGIQGMRPMEVARIIAVIARAIHYVHEKGILHRDLKPTNILIDKNGKPRVTDFGLAHREDTPDGFTITGQVLGTLGYISPEQVTRKSGTLSPRSDVYSLGAILYFLLTQRAPYVAGTPAEVIQAMLAGDPATPRKLNPSIPKDLETICLQALAREPGRRYASAGALAEDLENWISGKPIRARPAGLIERSWMVAKRHPLSTALTVVLLLSVVAGTWGILHGWRTAEKMQKATEVLNKELLDTTLRVNGNQAEALFREGHPHQAMAILASSIRLAPSNTVVASRLRSALTYRNFALPEMSRVGPPQHSFYSAFTPDGDRILTWDFRQEMRFWNAKTGEPVSAPMRHIGKVLFRGLDLSGQVLFAADVTNRVYFWDGRTGNPLGNYLHPDAACVAYNPVNRTFAIGLTNGEIRVASVFQPELPLKTWHASREPIGGLEYTTSGTRMMTYSQSGKVAAWDVPDNYGLVAEVSLPSAYVSSVVSPNGEFVLVFDAEGKVHLWDCQAAQVTTLKLGAYVSGAYAAGFSPDSQRIAVGLDDGQLEVFETSGGKRIAGWKAHVQSIMAVVFSPEGELIATSGLDGFVQIWNSHSGISILEPILLENTVNALDFDPTGARLLTSCGDIGTYVWDIRPGSARPTRLSEQEVLAGVAFDPVEPRVYTVSISGAIHEWNRKVGLESRVVRPSVLPISCAVFDPDVKSVVVATTNGAAYSTVLATGVTTRLETDSVRNDGETISFSQNSQQIAVLEEKGVVVVNHSTGVRRAGPFNCDGIPSPLAHLINRGRFSPDGRYMLTACRGFHATLWDIADGRALAEFFHDGPVVSAEFSPDGTRILTASLDSKLRIWNITNSLVPIVVIRQSGWPTMAMFNKKGNRILSGTIGGSVLAWNALTGNQTGLPMLHERYAFPMAFSPFDSEALTIEAGALRRWDAETGLPISEFIKTPDGENSSKLYEWSIRPAVNWSPNWDLFAAVHAGANYANVWSERPFPPLCPSWFPQLVEAMAVRILQNDGSQSSAPVEDILRIKNRLVSSTATDAWSLWGKWFFADRSRRGISWDSDTPIAKEIKWLVATDTPQSLREASRFNPVDPSILSLLAASLTQETNNPTRLGEQTFLRQRVINLARKHAPAE